MPVRAISLCGGEGNVALSSMNSQEAIFTMPDEDVVLTARYKKLFTITVNQGTYTVNGTAAAVRLSRAIRSLQRQALPPRPEVQPLGSDRCGRPDGGAAEERDPRV